MSANYKADIFAIVPVRVDEKKGITIRAEVVDDPVVTSVCLAIHNKFKTKGCYNIQLIKVDEASAIPFEINPRVSTTFSLSLAAGVDPIANFLLDVAGDNLQNYKKGLKLKRFWKNYIQ